jgi:regulatory protein
MPDRKPRPLDSQQLWEYALRALGGRAYSISGLREKLRRRAEKKEYADEVLSRLKEYGYLDDRKFAGHFAAARLENQGFGKSRVLRELRQQRVAPAVAEQAVKDAYGDTDETVLIEKFLRRKYRKIALGEYLADPRRLAATYRKLRLAGFSSSASVRALKRYAREPELLDSLDSPGDVEEEQPHP